jgi:hypothetical protein
MKRLFLALLGPLAIMVVGWVSTRVLLIVGCMALAVVIITLIERKDDFRGSIVLHRCCRDSHWIYLSFYILSIDLASSSSWLRGWLYAMVPISMTLYIFAAITTQQILVNANPTISGTQEEKRNLSIALSGLVLVVASAIAGNKDISSTLISWLGMS